MRPYFRTDELDSLDHQIRPGPATSSGDAPLGDDRVPGNALT